MALLRNEKTPLARALEFARSPDGTRLGIDPKHIVLAGHSMGGATAFVTAAGSTGLDGLILLDAWNIAGGTSRGPPRHCGHVIAHLKRAYLW